MPQTIFCHFSTSWRPRELVRKEREIGKCVFEKEIERKREREVKRKRDGWMNVGIFPQMWKKFCEKSEKIILCSCSISQILYDQGSTRVAQVLAPSLHLFSFFRKNGFPNKKVSQSFFERKIDRINLLSTFSLFSSICVAWHFIWIMGKVKCKFVR